MKSFRTTGRVSARHERTRDHRGLRRCLWLLTVLATAALFAFLPAAATGANPSADLDQCANGAAPSPSSDGCDVDAADWVNGNLGASKSVYFEGDSIPYRMVFDNLSLSTHTVTIEWDTTKSSKHAIDYIDNYNQSVLTANPCLGITMVPACVLTPPSTFAIPADPQVTGAGVTPIAGHLTMWGGTITSVDAPSSVGSTTCDATNTAGAYCYSAGTGFSGDKSAAIRVHFTASVANPVLAWGGHIAARKDWGLDSSAVSIPGSPYHTRLIDLDGAGGNQDRSLSAEAVIFPGFIHIIKHTTGGDATFGYTASPSPLADFNITTSGGTGEHDFDNIIDFQTYTVAENSPPAHWAFDSLNCSVASANGGTQTVNGMTATIALNEGEQVTCTYANHHVVNSPMIATLLSSSSITVGGTIHDSSTLSGTTSDAGGTVKYRYYSSLASCNDAANTFANPGGTSAGDKTVTNGSVPDSDAVQFNTAGTYYWRAWYSGDANNNPASSACAEEQLVVQPASPTITTQLSAGPIVVGASVHDSATLHNATATAGGTVKYRYYSSLASCSDAANTFASPGGTSAGDKTVTNGVVPDSDSIQFNVAGTYYWRAWYSGDVNNNPASSVCSEEQLVVQPASPTITTLLSGGPILVGGSVHDSAILHNATATAGGTVKYRYYSSLAACTAPGNTFASPGGSSAGDRTVTNGVVPNSDSVQFNVAGTYYWRAWYSGDNNNNAASSVCAEEALVVGKATPTITTELSDGPITVGDSVSDSATLTGATPTASGTVKYVYYSSLDACNDEGNSFASPGGTSAGEKTVTNGSVPDSDSIQFDVAGTYYWRAWYSGDNNNNEASSGCAEEQLVVNPATPTISTQLSETLGAVGDSITDSSSLSGATSDAGGTVKYTVYTDAACSQNAVDLGTKTVSDGSVPNSDAFKPSTPGDYFFQAVYSGDNNNVGTSSACTDEHLVIINPHISVVKSPDSQTVVSGQTATFTIQVINDGNVTLTNVVVTDALAPGCARTKTDIPGLASMPPAPAAGSTITYSCTLANVTSSFTNVATATGTPPVGPNVSSQDTAGVTVVQPVTHPAIAIAKNPNSQTVTKGGTATFTITVTNTGDVTLTNVVVTDVLSPNCDRNVGTLNPGQSVTYTCTKPNVQSNFTNVAVATGHAGSQTLTAQDSAAVAAKAPFVPPKPKVVSHKKPKATG